MTTGWTISIGYNSGDSYKGNPDKAWEHLRKAAELLRASPTKLADEARTFGAPEWCCEKKCSTLFEYCEVYARDWRDGGPLMIVDKPDDLYPLKQADFRPHLSITASGDRLLKEHVARAFVRLIMYEMHRKQIEINVRVA